MYRTFYGRFTTAKVGKTGLAVAGMAKMTTLTRAATPSVAAEVALDAFEIRRGWYGASIDLDPALDYAVTFVTGDTTVDAQEVASLWTEYSLRAESALPASVACPAFTAWAEATEFAAGAVLRDAADGLLYDVGTTHTSVSSSGEWAVGTTYGIGAIVSDPGGPGGWYYSVIADNLGNEPNTSGPSYWAGPFASVFAAARAIDTNNGSGYYAAHAAHDLVRLAAAGEFAGRAICIVAGAAAGEVSRIVSVSSDVATVRPAGDGAYLRADRAGRLAIRLLAAGRGERHHGGRW